MLHAIRCTALIGLLAVVASCRDSSLPTPPADSPAPSSSAGPPAGPIPFPEPTPFPGPGVYVFAPTTGVTVQWYTSGSRYVLNDDGTFVLQYPHVEYRGRYTVAGGHITFDWDGWSTAGPWGATGVSNGNSLTVKYNVIMMLSDFEDGVYVRTP